MKDMSIFAVSRALKKTGGGRRSDPSPPTTAPAGLRPPRLSPPLLNASGKIHTSLWWLLHLRCPHTRVVCVCVWGGLRADACSMSVFSFRRLQCVRRYVRLLNASCPTISLIRPPLLLLLPPRLPSHTHTLPRARHTHAAMNPAQASVGKETSYSICSSILFFLSLPSFLLSDLLPSSSLQPSLLTHSIP